MDPPSGISRCPNNQSAPLPCLLHCCYDHLHRIASPCPACTNWTSDLPNARYRRANGPAEVFKEEWAYDDGGYKCNPGQYSALIISVVIESFPCLGELKSSNESPFLVSRASFIYYREQGSVQSMQASLVQVDISAG
jgi:hypothetical protein